MNRALALLVLLGASTARADTLAQQVQLDVGIGVVGVGMELPVAEQLAVQLEATGFSTFYLPTIGGGVTTIGAGAGVRGTWFAGRDGRGLFVTTAFRLEQVGGDKAHEHGRGLAIAPAITIGQAFRATPKIDLRFGFGAQLIHYDIKTEAGPLTATVPFLAVELVVGYRL